MRPLSRHHQPAAQCNDGTSNSQQRHAAMQLLCRGRLLSPRQHTRWRGRISRDVRSTRWTHPPHLASLTHPARHAAKQQQITHLHRVPQAGFFPNLSQERQALLIQRNALHLRLWSSTERPALHASGRQTQRTRPCSSQWAAHEQRASNAAGRRRRPAVTCYVRTPHKRCSEVTLGSPPPQCCSAGWLRRTTTTAHLPRRG